MVSTHPEWQTDTLATPDLTNNQPEGSDWTYMTINPTTRVGNYTQISDKRIIISRTLDGTSKKPVVTRKLRVKQPKKGVELRIDIEAISISNQASAAGAALDAANRLAGGFRAWIATNNSFGSGGSAGGFNTGSKLVVAATNGTQRAFARIGARCHDPQHLQRWRQSRCPDAGTPYPKQVFLHLHVGHQRGLAALCGKAGPADADRCGG